MDLVSLLILVLVAGGLILLFLRENRRRGVRTVRAYLFIRAIGNGADVEKARAASDVDGKSLRKRDIHDTMLYLQAHYRGRQAALIKAAEKAGWRG
ncbi:hypothetical protein [Oricola cellulosilytica]|uniref:Uncharacterized protein n=1 Tax=Oricola cellulosilytica TaxID=1429082 RepID=A0A4V2MP00_9HYPH|nr:hypothetical protein [Oricola cellulosilytica]TCD15447.1 hypothetical protein E0D97_07920 [Oricola cellulosilytica]